MGGELGKKEMCGAKKNTDQPRTAPELDRRIGPEDLALIQHSAGTTGLQKGVALSLVPI